MPGEKVSMSIAELVGAISGGIAVVVAVFYPVRAEIRWRQAVNTDRKNLKKDKANQNQVTDIKHDVTDLLLTRKEFPRITVNECMKIQQRNVEIQKYNSELLSMRLKNGEKQFAAILAHQEKASEKQDQMLKMILGIYQQKGLGKWDGEDRRDDSNLSD